MELSEYAHISLKTISPMESANADLSHMAMGIAGEAGEVVDLIKKVVAYGRPLSLTALTAEVGDLMFYMNGLLHMTGVTWDEVMEANVSKLKVRYPDGTFDADRTNFRDKEAEGLAVVSSINRVGSAQP